MKLFFVVNPISGGIDKAPFLRKARALCKKYNIPHFIYKTTGRNDTQNLKQLLTVHRPDKVISVGGDGTTLFTSLALLDLGYPMGIIPLGSANGMARELYVNTNPVEALKDIIMSEWIAGLDILRINDTFYTMHLGDVGINAQLVESYEKDPNRGMATYAKYFLQELNNMRPFQVTIHANNKVYDDKVLMLGICNARKYGTGVPLNVDGNPMDGKFELVLVKRIDPATLIRAGLASIDEKFIDTNSGETIATEYAEIAFKTPRLLQLDGEVIGKFKDIKIEILKSAVQLITHGDNKYLPEK